MTIHEPATLVTDYLLGAFTAVLAWRLSTRPGGIEGEWQQRWAFAFAATAIASFAGGTVHGFPHVLGRRGTEVLWLVAMAALVLASLAIVLACALRWPGSWRTRHTVTVLVVALYALYGVWLLTHPAFVFAIAAYGAALIVLLVSQLWFHRQESAVRPFTWGVVVSAAAAAIQQSGWTPSRHFNYNDVYHVVQAVAIWLLYRGATAGRHP